jgi:osmotically inducible protein OsmC
MKRNASAVWSGGLKDGKGVVSSASGAVSNVPYNYRMRFEEEPGTNPEELIAAAHSACYSMFLAMVLEKAGLTAESISTKATVTLEPVDGAATVTSSALVTEVRSPNADAAALQKAAEEAKVGCPISRLLKANISLTAKLV